MIINLESALDRTNDVLQDKSNFGSAREITSRLDDLIDPIMSKVVSYNVKEIATRYRYIYERHLDLCYFYNDSQFKSFAIFAHFLEEYF
ncbi:hypothetical protein Y032_0921g3049 [Ancylostoma ceylanicum]|uniref:Uncharacterized protein n=1 Tax=Ancylostoma ceylanicum TaxID=53326 RepID=A0A016W8N9_9BILA|nr:hypothetical protein Y032_0921g3049 [Ancylostoma ceylanicum]